MSRENIFIGVDGGATKSKVIIENSQGQLLGQTRGGPVALRLGVTNSWKVVLATIRMALAEAGLSLDDKRYDFHVGMGLSGCEITPKYNEFIATEHPFANLVLVSDSYAACLGAHDGADGASIIIGTGTVGYQIQGDKIIQVSGWGFPHDDQGSGAWLGLKAIELTFKWLDGRLQETSPLLEMIWERFGKDTSEIVTWSNSANSTRFAEITPLVLQQIENKDPIAIRLIQSSAKEIDAVGAAIVRRTDEQKALPCTLFGGVSHFIEPWLGEELKKRIVSRKHDATVGAILALKKRIKI
ncbi:MAG: hypothetical protein A2X78_01775 [Gammaproteobacteria bacterium GWE2_37_16]|nr:MAG: hypothetical protein A2X78_01775 [Gammaproteobacteria bacterium GWE2_37_16]